MSQFDLVRRLQPNLNGNGSSHNGANGGSLHGGSADGLPLAAPQLGVVEQTAAPNGNGLTAASPAAPFDGEELLLPAGDEFVGLTAVLESLLFVAGEPVEAQHLAKTLGLKREEVARGMSILAEEYKRRAGGLRVQVHNGRYQLVTAPSSARFVEDFLNIDASAKLSAAALETLAIVAYRQPVTRVQIEAIRGVDSSGVLRSLTARGLIEEAGRLDVVGRPIVYGVTELFLQHFGLTDIGELPPLSETDADSLHAVTALTEDDGEAPVAALTAAAQSSADNRKQAYPANQDAT